MAAANVSQWALQILQKYKIDLKDYTRASKKYEAALHDLIEGKLSAAIASASVTNSASATKINVNDKLNALTTLSSEVKNL